MTLREVISFYPMGMKRQFVTSQMSGDEKTFHYFTIDLGFVLAYFEEDEDGWFMQLGESYKKYYKHQSVDDILGGILYGN